MLPAPARWLASARSSVLPLSSQSGGTPCQPVGGEVIWINGTNSAIRSRDNLCRIFQGLDGPLALGVGQCGLSLQGALFQMCDLLPQWTAHQLCLAGLKVPYLLFRIQAPARRDGRHGLLDRESPGALHLFEPFKHLVNPTLPPGVTGRCQE